MTWLLASGLVAAIVIIGATVAGGFWFARKALRRTEQLGDYREGMESAGRLNDKWKRTVDDLKQGLANKTNQLLREVAARKSVEEQRDRAIKHLQDSGDPEGHAAAIRADIGRLQELSKMSSSAPAKDHHDD